MIIVIQKGKQTFSPTIVYIWQCGKLWMEFTKERECSFPNNIMFLMAKFCLVSKDEEKAKFC